MNKKIFLTLISIPFLVLAVWTGYMGYQSLYMPEVTIKIQGYDPRSILSGHYIAYRIDWDGTDCKQFPENICPQKDFDKATFDFYGYSHGRHRFYIPQKDAPKLDNLFLSANKNGDVFEVVYSYKKGFKPIAKRLLINGKPWQEALKK